MKESPGPVARSAVAVALVAGLAAGCGEDGETVEVLSPPADAVVSLPFEVTLDASVPLGSSDEGLHHLHIWFGDDQESYLVVESTVVEITTAPIGAHEMQVSLREADHSETGVQTSVPLVITDG